MSDINKKARVLAFYLPQFHPTPENDLWWGKGFTEWTNVGKAKQLFKNHYQPRTPADLGYYDLRVPETRQAQAKMAETYGVEGFIYWHYWFGNGKRLLEMPFNKVLESGEPNFPFCLAWANETWRGFAHGLKNRNLLIEQLYPGEKDYIAHFHAILPALKDKRYITVNNKPLFIIYKPLDLPNADRFISIWQDLAMKNGLQGIYFVGQTPNIEDKKSILSLGLDSINVVRIFDYVKKRGYLKKIWQRLQVNLFNYPKVFRYSDVMKNFSGVEDKEKDVIPCLFPNWDHTPRSGREGIVFHNSTPELFNKHVSDIVDLVKDKPEEEKLIFIKSWNEWAEGNYMEPDLKFGTEYLNVLKKNIG